ncbi:MAG: hypothetical protein H8E34_03945 [Bacteroidetes bacterium]|nr:hypothetical protein [Bacteroidota bacterium]MBL6943188.1 hypothetical protein [Bacteroidales bacterium]
MPAIDNIKNRLIDRILAAKNEKLLEAIENILVSTQKEEIISLTSEQIELLMMSEQDIGYGNLVSESELEKLDKQWFD